MTRFLAAGFGFVSALVLGSVVARLTNVPLGVGTALFLWSIILASISR